MRSCSMEVVIQPHSFCEELSSMWSYWLDMPKLTTLTSDNGNSYTETFEYPRHITLESDSYLTSLVIRYASSQQRLPESQLCIPVQERRHNPRKYSLHSFLTNRHRGSSTLLQLITQRHVTPLFVPHTTPSHPPQSSFSGIGESVIAVRTRK